MFVLLASHQGTLPTASAATTRSLRILETTPPATTTAKTSTAATNTTQCIFDWSTSGSVAAAGAGARLLQEWAAYYAEQSIAAAQTAAVQTAVAQTAVAVQNATQINTVETAVASDMHLVVASSQSTTVTMGQETVNIYHKQFHWYTYYYKEEATRKYYGVWSPQQGTPNPYGTNPNGITAPLQSRAPAPSAAAATAIMAANVQHLLTGLTLV